MAVRRWLVRPDMQIHTAEGPLAVVSRGLQDQAFLDGAAMVANAGGLFSARAERYATGVPGEMATVWLMCEWADRTDAKSQPEPHGAPLPEYTDQAEAEPRLTAEEWAAVQDIQDAADAESEEAAQDVQDAAQEAGAAVLRSPDGLDYTQLEDEDLAEVPEGAR
jgi:hypothetical protein